MTAIPMSAIRCLARARRYGAQVGQRAATSVAASTQTFFMPWQSWRL